MECSVKITTSVDGGESFYSSRGEIERTADGSGFVVLYKFDGDECRLEIRDDAVSQRRRGSLNMDVAFADGEEVVMIISDDDGGAEVAVKCGKILCECFRRGIFCTLNYCIEPSVFSVKIAVIAAVDLSGLK